MHEFAPHLFGVIIGFDAILVLLLMSCLAVLWAVSYTHLTLPTNREV